MSFKAIEHSGSVSQEQAAASSRALARALGSDWAAEPTDWTSLERWAARRRGEHWPHDKVGSASAAARHKVSGIRVALDRGGGRMIAVMRKPPHGPHAHQWVETLDQARDTARSIMTKAD